MFSHMLCPILGDELYGNRLIDIDGRPATVQPKDLRRVRNARFFPRYGWMLGLPRSEQDVVDLYANAAPAQHFLAMVEALGMNGTLMRYFQEDDNDDERLVAGDEKF